MGLIASNMLGLKVFHPSSVLDESLKFFEFLKYDAKNFRDETIVLKSELIESFLNHSKQKQQKFKTKDIEKKFDGFAKNLDRALYAKNSESELSDILWKRIDGFCSLLRMIERSDERKIRWALFHLFSGGNQRISVGDVSNLLADFKLKNMEKIINKIVKAETLSGLDASFDDGVLFINHETNDKLVGHYLADAIDEPLRRSPGELQQEILDLIDEGSYSNQEISQALLADEALVSRTVKKLRDDNKIVLSSFGSRGTRYFTTNCDNCPFGTTKASCRKEALSYIISAFMEDFSLDLNANDFDGVDTNQALLKIKRIVMMARKEKNTKLERNLGESLSVLLSRVVDKYVEVEVPDKKVPNVPEIKIQGMSNLARLPMLYQLGLRKGSQGGIHLMDEMLHFASRSIKKEDRLKIKKHALNEANKFLKNIGLDQNNSD